MDITHKDCLVCRRIAQIHAGQNPFFVAELETGYVVLGDHQHFEGYTLLLCKQHQHELHELEQPFRLRFLEEMSLVAQAVYHAFSPQKLNYELLGNGDSHLHWHIFPRRDGDTPTPGPVWWMDRAQMYDPRHIPGDERREQLKSKLFDALQSVLAANSPSVKR